MIKLIESRLKESKFILDPSNFNVLFNFIAQEFKNEFSKRKWFNGDLEFDDIELQDRAISFQLYVYPDKKNLKKYYWDSFVLGIDYADAESESLDEVKEVLKSRISDQVSEFTAWVMRK